MMCSEQQENACGTVESPEKLAPTYPAWVREFIEQRLDAYIARQKCLRTRAENTPIKRRPE
jgi:hypothetical protein